MEVIKVGIADLKVAKNPGVLVTIGLGSCVGIALYDKVNKVGALIHIMLPKSTEVKAKDNKAKFADTSIPVALNEMEKMGAKKSNITAKIAGGARMFSFVTTDVMNVGDRNVVATKDVLKEHGIKLLKHDTGGNKGRTVEFETATGKVRIKSMGKEVKEL